MKIIDNRKDYYDHISNIRGFDEKIIFDRRNGVVVENSDLMRNNKRLDSYWLLEVGFFQYIIKPMRNRGLVLIHTKDSNKNYSGYPVFLCRVTYLHSTEGISNLDDIIITADIPACLTDQVTDNWIFRVFAKNPILKNSGINKIVPAEDMWQNIYNFLLNQTGQNIQDNRTDVQKLESFGFDKKSSFRNV